MLAGRSRPPTDPRGEKDFMPRSPTWSRLVLVVLGFFGLLAQGRAELLTSAPGLNGLGSFSGTFDYVAADAGNATLTVVLTNASPVPNGGYLTAFAFNNPLNLITGVVLTPSDLDFGLIADGDFNNGIRAQPFGRFDIGASTSRRWRGGGSPSEGIGVDSSATFSFALTGSNLDTLTASSFFDVFSENAKRGGPKSFIARFRGFEDCGNDKVPGLIGISALDEPCDDPPPTDQPEPGTLILLGIGVCSLVGFASVKRKSV
jgi:hypothetical protein